MSKKRLDAMQYASLICGGAGVDAEKLAEAYFEHDGESILSNLLLNAENPDEITGLLTLMSYDVTKEDPTAKSSFDKIQGKIVSEFCNEDNYEFFETNVINKDLDEKGNIIDYSSAKEVLESKKNVAGLGLSKAA